MSLVGFPAENHPQQVGKRAARDDVDDRGTHPIHFAEFEAEFGPFTLDVAAAEHNAKCDAYYDRDSDGLAQPWHGVVWCNPPYSGLAAWLEKAWHEWQNRDVKRIVMLLPANRTEQRWWQDHVEPHRDDRSSSLRVRFLPGRMRFIRPNVVIGPKGDRPPFGCCLLIWADPTPGVFMDAVEFMEAAA
jgi:phage N-6-adenine-methyltransferase